MHVEYLFFPLIKAMKISFRLGCSRHLGAYIKRSNKLVLLCKNKSILKFQFNYTFYIRGKNQKRDSVIKEQ